MSEEKSVALPSPPELTSTPTSSLQCPVAGVVPLGSVCPEATRICPQVGVVPAGSKCPNAKKECPKGFGTMPAGSVCPKVKKVKFPIAFHLFV
jgi:hypothetical protein